MAPIYCLPGGLPHPLCWISGLRAKAGGSGSRSRTALGAGRGAPIAGLRSGTSWWVEPVTSHEPAILAEHAGWLVVAKPAGWHTVRGKTESDDAGGGVVESWLATARPDLASLPESGLVHRLDRDTSGCLVVAKDPAAYERLRAAFAAATGLRKIYLCRAKPGLPSDDRATLFFASRHKGSAKVTVRESGAAREAGRLRWRVLDRAAGGDLVEVELIGPGRRHQIRAGLAYLGHPLVGDELYGGGAGTPLLHAWKVEVDGTEVEAPKPAWVSFDETGHRSPA